MGQSLKSGQAEPARFVVKIDHIDNQSRFFLLLIFYKDLRIGRILCGCQKAVTKRARNMAATLGQAVGGCEGACCPAASKSGFAHVSHKSCGTWTERAGPIPLAVVSNVTSSLEPTWGEEAESGGPQVAKWCKTDSARLRSRSMCESRKPGLSQTHLVTSDHQR